MARQLQRPKELQIERGKIGMTKLLQEAKQQLEENLRFILVGEQMRTLLKYVTGKSTKESLLVKKRFSVVAKPNRGLK